MLEMYEGRTIIPRLWQLLIRETTLADDKEVSDYGFVVVMLSKSKTKLRALLGLQLRPSTQPASTTPAVVP